MRATSSGQEQWPVQADRPWRYTLGVCSTYLINYLLLPTQSLACDKKEAARGGPREENGFLLAVTETRLAPQLRGRHARNPTLEMAVHPAPNGALSVRHQLRLLP